MTKSMNEMPEPTYFVLASLLDRPLHGYAIIKRAAELSGTGSVWPPERCTQRWTGLTAVVM